MPSSYTSSLRLVLPVTGELTSIWGDTVNNGLTKLVEDAIAGTASVAMGDANVTLTTATEAADQARCMFITLTGALTAQRNVVCPSQSKLYFVTNSTSGGFSINFKTGAGAGVLVPPGERIALYCDGTDVLAADTSNRVLDQGVEADLASAATTDIGNQTTPFLRITGTTGITSFGTAYKGPRYLRFADALLLTHNASTLLLPTGANITTAAGDSALLVPVGNPSSGWLVAFYQRATGAALAVDLNAATGVLAVAKGGTGKTDGSNLYDTGDIKYSVRTTAQAGWVKADGLTIGSAASGATNRANADTEALFTLLWSGTTNTTLPIQTSAGGASTRGANAAADFAANKRMPLPDMRSEVLRGLDDGRGVDTGRANLSSQLDAFQGHRMSITMLGGTGSYYGFGGTTGNANVTDPPSADIGPPKSDGVNGAPRVANETRMRNVAASVFIKL